MTQHSRAAQTEPGPQVRPEPAEPPGNRPWWRQPYLWLVVLGGLVALNLFHALPRYLIPDSSQARIILDPDFGLHYPVVAVHAVTGNIAMVTVLLQLWPWLRRTHPAIHRLTGRFYIFAGALPAASLGLWLVPYRPLNTGSMGIAISGALWIVTTLVGFRMTLKGRYAEHRRWMTYSFALAMHTTLGRIIFYMITYISGFTMDVTILLETANWFSWVGALLAAHIWLEWRAKRTSVGGGEVVAYGPPAGAPVAAGTREP